MRSLGIEGLHLNAKGHLFTHQVLELRVFTADLYAGICQFEAGIKEEIIHIHLREMEVFFAQGDTVIQQPTVFHIPLDKIAVQSLGVVCASHYKVIILQHFLKVKLHRGLPVVFLLAGFQADVVKEILSIVYILIFIEEEVLEYLPGDQLAHLLILQSL